MNIRIVDISERHGLEGHAFGKGFVWVHAACPGCVLALSCPAAAACLVPQPPGRFWGNAERDFHELSSFYGEVREAFMLCASMKNGHEGSVSVGDQAFSCTALGQCLSPAPC